VSGLRDGGCVATAAAASPRRRRRQKCEKTRPARTRPPRARRKGHTCPFCRPVRGEGRRGRLGGSKAFGGGASKKANNAISFRRFGCVRRSPLARARAPNKRLTARRARHAQGLHHVGRRVLCCGARSCSCEEGGAERRVGGERERWVWVWRAPRFRSRGVFECEEGDRTMRPMCERAEMVCVRGTARRGGAQVEAPGAVRPSAAMLSPSPVPLRRRAAPSLFRPLLSARLPLHPHNPVAVDTIPLRITLYKEQLGGGSAPYPNHEPGGGSSSRSLGRTTRARPCLSPVHDHPIPTGLLDTFDGHLILASAGTWGCAGVRRLGESVAFLALSPLEVKVVPARQDDEQFNGPAARV